MNGNSSDLPQESVDTREAEANRLGATSAPPPKSQATAALGATSGPPPPKLREVAVLAAGVDADGDSYVNESKHDRSARRLDKIEDPSQTGTLRCMTVDLLNP